MHNIIFLCSSLEPGKDGVGDYTRKLAGELIKQGNKAAIISLNDKMDSSGIIGVQYDNEIEIPVLRFTAIEAFDSGLIKAKEFIEMHNPSWISLQYVPYGFDNRGLPYGLAKKLLSYTTGRKFHIMFHELWIGISVISPMKHKVVGFMQRRIAASLVKTLKPVLITTTNLLYKLILKKIKSEASILPLFGNIPAAPMDAPFREDVLKRLGIFEEDLNHYYFIGIFGNLYPEADLENTLSNQLKVATSANKNMAFIGFGNMNEQGMQEFNRLKEIFQKEIKFLHMGIQPEDKISNLLQLLNLGISCTPSQHIGKSGVFATMKLHGLEVILPVGDIIPEYDSEISEYNQLFVQRPQNNWSVAYIAGQFDQLLVHTIRDNKTQIINTI